MVLKVSSNINSPLADRLRPNVIDDLVGQEHLFGERNFFERLLDSTSLPNIILHGPPGVGKTSLAMVISRKTNKKFFKLNATSCTVTDIKSIIKDASSVIAPNGIIIYLDEIQYFSKKQQQTLLEYIENGKITLIASTTENPYFYVYPAILSRSHVLEFKHVSNEQIIKNLKRAVFFLETENNIKINISEEIFSQIAKNSGGDVRRSINILELCFISSETKNGQKNIIYGENIKNLSKNYLTNHNKSGDEHYDLLSAFQKSLRGSDPNASIYYLARLLSVGEIISACRRLMVCACEDVGLANPNIFSQVKSLVDIAMQVGMPEARIPLADAVLLVALSPKSNSAYLAINSAMSDISNNLIYDAPEHLCNLSIEIKNYLYPHNFPNHYVEQQYLPEELKNKRYYYAQENKFEQAFENYQKSIKK